MQREIGVAANSINNMQLTTKAAAPSNLKKSFNISNAPKVFAMLFFLFSPKDESKKVNPNLTQKNTKSKPTIDISTIAQTRRISKKKIETKKQTAANKVMHKDLKSHHAPFIDQIESNAD